MCVKLITPLVITQQVVEQLIASREENVFAFVICICNSYLLGAVHKWGYHLGAGIQTLKIFVFFHKQRYPQNICQAWNICHLWSIFFNWWIYWIIQFPQNCSANISRCCWTLLLAFSFSKSLTVTFKTWTSFLDSQNKITNDLILSAENKTG